MIDTVTLVSPFPNLQNKQTSQSHIYVDPLYILTARIWYRIVVSFGQLLHCHIVDIFKRPHILTHMQHHIFQVIISWFLNSISISPQLLMSNTDQHCHSLTVTLILIAPLPQILPPSPFAVLLAFPLSHVSLPFPPLHYVESPSSSMPTDTPPLITSSFSHTIHICIILLSCPTHIIHSSSVRRCCVVSYRNLLCLTWCENKIHDRVNCSTYC